MKKITRKRKKVFIIIGVILLIIIAFRLALPSILLKAVNRELARIDGYNGSVEDIDVAIIRGAYTINGIKLDKTGGKIPVPFFYAESIDLSVEWSAIFNGSIVGEIEVRKPMLNFVKGPSESSSQTDVDNDWIDVVDNLMPLKLNRLEIFDGEVHYRDYHSSPKVDIFATNLHIHAANLSNAKDQEEELPSTVLATANLKGGTAMLNMKLDPLNRNVRFDVNAELKDLNLVELNDFLRAYGNFDVSKGMFSLYMEAAAKDNKLAGYVKPILKDLKVLEWKTDDESPIRLAWEAVVSGIAFIFKNQKEDQVATRAEFSGNLDNPDVNIWGIIGQVLRNAFIQALYPSLEHGINLNSIGGKDDEPNTKLGKAFESIPGKKDNSEKDKKKN